MADRGSLADPVTVRSELQAEAAPDQVAQARIRLQDLDRQLAEDFDAGAPTALLLARRADAVDDLLRVAWKREKAPGCALFATGGYGRGQLYPHSDIDLLILRDQNTSPDAIAQCVGRFLSALWDAGLKPGHSVRTLGACREAAGDLTVFTSLMEARLLSGSDNAPAALAATLASEWPAARYLEARRASQRERHARFNDTAYNLEPNIKEGPGGLRDLDTLRWIALRLTGDGSLQHAESAGLLTAPERSALESATAHLARVRFALHRAAGRAEERLLFDHQRQLAREAGLTDEHAGNLAVEQFMQAWFRAAQTVDRLNEQVSRRAGEALARAAGTQQTQALDARWQLIEGALAAVDTVSSLGATELFEPFAWLARRADIVGFHSSTTALVDRSVAELGPKFREDAAVGPAFMDLLRGGGDVSRVIAAMGRHGVLAEVLPAFGKVTGRMQYDLFHVYTVDQHTLFVVRNLLGFAHRDSALTALGHTLWRRQPKTELVLLAGLFHDIAKGRGGDHSELGEVEVRNAAPRLGLGAADAGFVAWLVRQHLLMSVTAQKHDIADPEVVHRFATEVADTERLDALYLLTVADIQGTSPRLWNAWKAQLLEDLHAAARHALRRGLADPVGAAERVATIRQEALLRLESSGVTPAEAAAMWQPLPDYAVLRLGAERLAWATVELMAQRGSAVQIVARAVGGDALDLIVNAPDRDGLFATVTAVLDRQGFDVVEARATGTRDGRVLDLFRLLPRSDLVETLEVAGERMVASLREALSSTTLHVRPARRRLSRQLRHFTVPLRAEFRDLPRPPRTQLSLVCADRPGLLARVAASFQECNLRVHDARIATFGERAEDFFELTGSDLQRLDIAQQDRLLATLRQRLEDGDD